MAVQDLLTSLIHASLKASGAHKDHLGWDCTPLHWDSLDPNQSRPQRLCIRDSRCKEGKDKVSEGRTQIFVSQGLAIGQTLGLTLGFCTKA